MNNNKLFEQIKVWKKVDESNAHVYNCFKDLDTELFHVQSKDYYTSPITVEQSSFFLNQEIELFLEDLPSEREKGYKSIPLAIKAFDDYFNEE